MTSTDASGELDAAVAQRVQELKRIHQESTTIQREADAGDADKQFEFGGRLEAGQGVRRDLRAAAEYYSKAAAGGHSGAMLKLGLLQQDPAQAFAWYSKAAALGHAPSQCKLGQCLLQGNGTTRDEKTGATWLQKAASAGDLDADVQLAQCLETGRGIARDEKAAAAVYAKHADRHLLAKVRLGVCLEKGSGVAQDAARAVQCYREAADGGWAVGAARLGLCQLRGVGGPADPAAAVLTLSKHAQDPEVAFLLGVCVEGGVGIARDETSALGLFERSARGGHAPAVERLVQIYKEKLEFWTQQLQQLRQQAPDGNADTGSGAGARVEGSSGSAAAVSVVEQKQGSS